MLKKGKIPNGTNGALPNSVSFKELLVRPLPFPDENVRGYRLRLAYVNGIPSPSWLDKMTGLEKFSNNGAHTRWCPMCLDGKTAYWKSSWERNAPICVRHNCWLTDTCRKCNRVLSWRRVRFLTCSCEHSLVDNVPGNLSDPLGTLLTTSKRNEPKLWWHQISVERRFAVAHFLGALHVFGLIGKPLKKASQVAIAIEKEVLTIGAEILLGGECSFHELLNRIRIQRDSGFTYQLMRDAYPGLLLKMRRQLMFVEFEVFASYIRSHINGDAENDVCIVWRGNNNHIIKSAASTAKQLNIRLDRLLETLDKHGMKAKTRISITGRNMVVIGPQAVQKIQTKKNTLFSYRTASKLFGIPPTRIKLLVENDLIECIDERVDGQSILELFSQISALANKQGKYVPSKYIPLNQLVRTSIPVQYTIPVFKALLNGEIRIKISDMNPKNLAEFDVSKSDLGAFLQKVKKSDSNCVSIVDAALLMNLKQEVVYHLVRRKIIKVIRKKFGRRSANFVSARELDRFGSYAETLSCAANRAGVSNQRALKWAESKKLKLISGPSIDGGRQYFIEKVVSH